MVDPVIGANTLVEDRLTSHICEIEKCCKGDCLTFIGPIAQGADDAIRDTVENLPNRRSRLIFILETPGGFAEVARRIAEALRHHYRVIDFLIPSHAMSAGTILAMSGDAIYMDYYSVLGPIDPQVENKEGRLIPALGYLIRYEDLLDKANAGQISTAEMTILLGFDQGDLFAYEQARELSRALLKEWLVKYKFKDWKRTKTHRRKVTRAMKRQRAEEIAKKLDDVRKWNSHGLGISMKLLTKDVKLRIDDFGANRDLNGAVRRYHRLLTDYMIKMRHGVVIHTRQGYQPLVRG